MENKYKSAGGSYYIKRTAKAYDKDKSPNKNKKGSRQYMEYRNNLSKEARKVLTDDEQKELAAKSGTAGVSTGGGDKLPAGSKDNQFYVAEDVEEAEKVRKEFKDGGIKMPVRVQQERNKDGTFAEDDTNDKYEDKKDDEDEEENRKTQLSKDRRFVNRYLSRKKDIEERAEHENVWEALGISREEAERRLAAIGYTYEEFNREMLKTYGQLRIHSRMEKENADEDKKFDEAQKRLNDPDSPHKAKYKKQQAEEAKKDKYPYKEFTGHTREEFVLNYKTIDKELNAYIQAIGKDSLENLNHFLKVIKAKKQPGLGESTIEQQRKWVAGLVKAGANVDSLFPEKTKEESEEEKANKLFGLNKRN